jgi:hypothetical protein
MLAGKALAGKALAGTRLKSWRELAASGLHGAAVDLLCNCSSS